MTREEAIKELERISEDTVQRECSTCGRLHIGTYSGICALCSLCECVPDYAKEYHKKYQTVSRWKWNGRWANEALDMAIAALREQPRWIPVEERLPEKKGQYLVYTKWTYGNFTRLCNWTPKYNGWEEHLNGRAIWYNYDSEYGDYECKDITHWMPLPEPPEVEV